MNLSRKRVLEIASACKAITSLHVTIDEKDEMYLIDAIESEKISDPFESSFKAPLYIHLHAQYCRNYYGNQNGIFDCALSSFTK